MSKMSDFQEYCAGLDEDGFPLEEAEMMCKFTDPRPSPCVRDEHGEIRQQTVKALLAKIDEELNELKEAVFRSEEYDNDLNEFSNSIHEFEKEPIAEEAADTITAITTLCAAVGINTEAREEAQRRVNAKNKERGRL